MHAAARRRRRSIRSAELLRKFCAVIVVVAVLLSLQESITLLGDTVRGGIARLRQPDYVTHGNQL